MPGFRLGMYHVPSGVVTLPKTNPASVFVTVILAPGTTEPVQSEKTRHHCRGPRFDELGKYAARQQNTL